MGRIDDGYATFFQLGSNPFTTLWEKTVTPPSIEGGGANETTTMHNKIWRTNSPKKLKSLGESSFSAAYDPSCYDDLVDVINVNQTMTLTFADGATLLFWGWLDSFVPDEVEEGSQPTAQCTIIPSNQNETGVETGPTYTGPPAGYDPSQNTFEARQKSNALLRQKMAQEAIDKAKTDLEEAETQKAEADKLVEKLSKTPEEPKGPDDKTSTTGEKVSGMKPADTTVNTVEDTSATNTGTPVGKNGTSTNSRKS